MDFRDIIASLTIHAAIICSVCGLANLRTSPDSTLEAVPIFFEIVEESLPPISSENPGTAPENLPPEKGTALEKTEAVPQDPSEKPPEEQVTAPEIQPSELGTAPEETGTASEIEPEKPGTAPEISPPEMGTALEILEAVPEKPPPKTEAVPDNQPEEMGTAPVEEDGNIEKYADASGELPNIGNAAEHAKVVSDPIALNRIVPKYPRSARRKGHEGSVTVEITVTEGGLVSSADIVSSSGHAELDAAALAAVRTARFTPATTDGVSVSGRLRLTFDFKLE